MQALILVATKGWSDKLARIGVLRASNRPATRRNKCTAAQLVAQLPPE
jgi:hypothetical protein